jgi:hypothetical protein
MRFWGLVWVLVSRLVRGWSSTYIIGPSLMLINEAGFRLKKREPCSISTKKSCPCLCQLESARTSVGQSNLLLVTLK